MAKENFNTIDVRSANNMIGLGLTIARSEEGRVARLLRCDQTLLSLEAGESAYLDW